jgi:hypothetical protein
LIRSDSRCAELSVSRHPCYKYYDEHVAELYQGISERDVRRDFSADAIRKKRDRLLTQYPHVYAEALEMAKNCAQGCN